MASIKKVRENEKKRQLIAKMLASFAVTATVVVTVVIANQNPVTADFLTVDAIGNEIVYRLDVQDPDSRIASETLRLEVKGSTEKYYIPLELGESQGSQIVFGNSSSYTLLISADLGFGRETLDSETVELTNSLAGFIFDVRLDPEISQNEESSTLTYLVDTKYFDPESKVESAILEYAYVYEEEYPQPQKYDPNNLQYQSILIEGKTATTTLENISNYNVTIHLRLVVYLSGEEAAIILDEYAFSTPFRFFGSLYVQDVGSEYAVFSVYVDNPQDISIEIWVDVYFENNLITSLPVSFAEESGQSEGAQVRIEHLMPNAPHSAALRARYIDSDTNKEKNVVLEPVTFMTAKMYRWELTSFVDNGSSYDVIITTDDPFAIIQSASCSIIGLDEDRNYLTSYNYNLSAEALGPTVVYSATIEKPAEQYYDLELSLSKLINQVYYTEIIHTLGV